MLPTTPILDRAREMAEGVLWPDDAEVDRADRIPARHLDLLADQGFYGLSTELELAALATRAAAGLAAATGSAAVLRGSHPERLTREALFLQVFASRPAIRSALLRGYIGVPKS